MQANSFGATASSRAITIFSSHPQSLFYFPSLKCSCVRAFAPRCRPRCLHPSNRFIALGLSHDLSFSFSLFFPSPQPLFRSFALSRSFPYHDSRSASSRRDEVRGKLKYADFYRRPRAVNERMGEPGMKNEKGLDHKGCGRPDFTGRRVLGNYRTFKVRKGSVTHYLTLDTSIVKSSTPPCSLPLARILLDKCKARMGNSSGC